MLKRANLKNLNVLLADADPLMIGLLSSALEEMGMQNIQHAKSSDDAIQHMAAQPADLLITEWQIEPADGIALTGNLRKSNESPMRTLPIIMLTARSEKKDVEQARDAGITEFVSKPYDAQTLFHRIQQVVDYPRPFIVTEHYAGPDRRRRQEERAEPEERRRTKPRPALEMELAAPPAEPIILSPNFAIKRKIGLNGPLDSIITPKMLMNTQKALAASRNVVRPWVERDIHDMENNYDTLCASPTPRLVERFKNAALSIKARTGMINDEMTYGVAQLMYLFMRNQYSIGNRGHNVVVRKHLQALQVVFNGNFGGTLLGHELLQELHNLALMVM